MSAQRPGVRGTNTARRILDRWDYETTQLLEQDVAAAQAYALIGLAEAVGDVALSLRKLAERDGATS